MPDASCARPRRRRNGGEGDHRHLRHARHREQACATTTFGRSAANQRSQACLSRQSRPPGAYPNTVAQWRSRATVEHRKTRAPEPRATGLTEAGEAMVVASGRHAGARGRTERQYRDRNTHHTGCGTGLSGVRRIGLSGNLCKRTALRRSRAHLGRARKENFRIGDARPPPIRCFLGRLPGSESASLITWQEGQADAVLPASLGNRGTRPAWEREALPKIAKPCAALRRQGDRRSGRTIGKRHPGCDRITGNAQILSGFPELVGARGFEPPTPCSRSRCATRLRYAPTLRCGLPLPPGFGKSPQT